MFGEKPQGAVYYARQGRFELIAWSPPPPPGDELCRAITGRSEEQLVRDILFQSTPPVGSDRASIPQYGANIKEDLLEEGDRNVAKTEKSPPLAV